MDERAVKAFQNYLREFYLTKADLRKFRARMNRAFLSKETMIDALNQHPHLMTNKEEISENVFQKNKTMVFDAIDAYEARLNDDS